MAGSVRTLRYGITYRKEASEENSLRVIRGRMDLGAGRKQVLVNGTVGRKSDGYAEKPIVNRRHIISGSGLGIPGVCCGSLGSHLAPTLLENTPSSSTSLLWRSKLSAPDRECWCKRTAEAYYRQPRSSAPYGRVGTLIAPTSPLVTPPTLSLPGSSGSTVGASLSDQPRAGHSSRAYE